MVGQRIATQPWFDFCENSTGSSLIPIVNVPREPAASGSWKVLKSGSGASFDPLDAINVKCETRVTGGVIKLIVTRYEPAVLVSAWNTHEPVQLSYVGQERFNPANYSVVAEDEFVAACDEAVSFAQRLNVGHVDTPSLATLALARQALQTQQKLQQEDVDVWAERLAREVCADTD